MHKYLSIIPREFNRIECKVEGNVQLFYDLLL